MEKTFLDKKILKNIEKYTLDNKELPILMQKYPWLVQVARNTLSKTNLLMVEHYLDYSYFILKEIIKESLVNTPEGAWVDIEKFFKILEDVLISIFEIRTITYPKNCKQKIIINDIIKKFELEESLKDLMKMKTWGSKIKIQSTLKIQNYIEHMKNNV
jgi:hypothetical protein